jgi:hypothetical protein
MNCLATLTPDYRISETWLERLQSMLSAVGFVFYSSDNIHYHDPTSKGRYDISRFAQIDLPPSAPGMN